MTPAKVDGWKVKPTKGILIHQLVLVNESEIVGWKRVYSSKTITTGIIRIDIPLK